MSDEARQKQIRLVKVWAPATEEKTGRKPFDGKDYLKVLEDLSAAWILKATDAMAAHNAGISPSALCQFLKANPRVAQLRDQLRANNSLQSLTAIDDQIKQGDGRLALRLLEITEPEGFSKQAAGFQGSIVVTPENTTIKFNDGLDEPKVLPAPEEPKQITNG